MVHAAVSMRIPPQMKLAVQAFVSLRGRTVWNFGSLDLHCTADQLADWETDHEHGNGPRGNQVTEIVDAVGP